MKESRLTLWQRVKDRTGKDPQGLDERPDISPEAGALWSLYVLIRSGCDRVGYMEIDSYQRVTGERLTPWEADIMIAIDQARRSNGN